MDKKAVPGDSARHSSIGPARRFATWVGMLGGQFLVWGLLLWLSASLNANLMFLMFAAPLPALTLAYTQLRPSRLRPEDQQADDWGVTLGHAWVRIAHSVHWMPRTDMEAYATDPSPVGVQWTHAGFTMSVPRVSSGRPDIVSTSGVTLAALCAPAVLFVATYGVLGTASGGLWDAAMLAGWGSFCAIVGYGLLLAPWVALLGVYDWATLPSSYTEVTLDGRQVRSQGTSFVLGSPDQKIEQGVGTLTLEGGGQTLVIHGAGAHLAFLRDAFIAASRESGDAHEVPASLRRLKSGAVEGAR